MNIGQFGSVILVLGAVILPLVLSAYFSERVTPEVEDEEYDYR